MSTLRKRGLEIDDPLAPGRSEAREQEAPAEVQPESLGDGRSTPADRSTGEPEPASRGAQRPPEPGEVWREWSGISSVGSFRLPHELLTELSDTARETGLPVGLIVTAAVTQLLDQPADEIAALVDRADDARIQGRRRARRPLPSKQSDA
jgi:hypothetical protein